jgi:hypothetical protein
MQNLQHKNTQKQLPPQQAAPSVPASFVIGVGITASMLPLTQMIAL